MEKEKQKINKKNLYQAVLADIPIQCFHHLVAPFSKRYKPYLVMQKEKIGCII
jgi:hypothetical protein